ncbi:MAG: pseudoazurin [Sphingomonas sp.]|jgi:pseudoazurin|uniref:pseudoazurin n=2 Tax=Pseudomonadota TaxID=1224 RepID=UPI00068DB57B|nr:MULTISPECIES: pseudoazurin [unclassified Sphingomonas]MCP4029565.1 pseudoazurin [Sphingomonas sp.]MDR6848838.1 pseudoazurin [Sphingomonas sp. BE137]MDR7256122.1 pseudoazurin [Sphingomonas sp. BE270]RUN77871.1 pseudoazurin [Sphingomonas sp. TF3]
MMSRLIAAALCLTAALGATGVSAKAPKTVPAKTIVVEMRDSGPEGAMVFVPAFVKANPGDTVRFVPTSPVHNAELIPTMLPAGVTPSKGAMGKSFDLVVTTPGIYGIKCAPHYSMGMVAVVQAGDGPSANLAAARAANLPPFAKKRMVGYLAKAR